LRGPQKKHKNPWFISGEWITKIEAEFGKPDLVHFHFVYNSFQTAIARLLLKKGWPYITTPRGSLTYLAQNQKRIKKVLANVLYYNSFIKNAAAVHALCPNEANDIELLFKTKKIFTIPNGIEDRVLDAYNKLSPVDLSNLKTNGRLLLGFVGRIDIYHKGLDLLIEALGTLKIRNNQSKFSLFIVGPFKTKQDEIKINHLISKYNLQEDIQLLGSKYNEEKFRHVLACDVFVHPSRFEGMPMALTEALALGRPSLATPGTNIADIVLRAGGWNCEPNPESIANSLNEIYGQKEKLKQIGKQAHELINKEFTWREIARRMKVEYEKLI
jgi:glycosyltransferase involved in cell wall biosynthesis